MEIGLLVSAADLKFEGHKAELDVDVVAKTMDYQEVARASHVVRHPQPPTPSKPLMADRISLELAPGDYRLALQVRDLRSGDVGVFTTESRVRGFTKSRLEISDLQLASTIETGRSGHRFSKGDILVVPHPGGVFPQGSEVRLYFEIYGLTLPFSNWAEYTVTFTVTQEGDEDDRPSVAISSDATAKTGDVQRYFSFETSKMEPGLYDVEVHVTDKVANTSASQKAMLRVDAKKGVKES